MVETCFCSHVDLFDDLPQSIYYSHASRSEWTFPWGSASVVPADCDSVVPADSVSVVPAMNCLK